MNQSLSSSADPSPSVTVLIRGTAGRHAWTMQLFHQPRGARANQRVRSHCATCRIPKQTPPSKESPSTLAIRLQLSHISPLSSCCTDIITVCRPVTVQHFFSHSRCSSRRVDRHRTTTWASNTTSSKGLFPRRWIRFRWSKLMSAFLI